MPAMSDALTVGPAEPVSPIFWSVGGCKGVRLEYRIVIEGAGGRISAMLVFDSILLTWPPWLFVPAFDPEELPNVLMARIELGYRSRETEEPIRIAVICKDIVSACRCCRCDCRCKKALMMSSLLMSNLPQMVCYSRAFA